MMHRVRMDWKQAWRQPSMWLAFLIAISGTVLVLQQRVSHYLSLQSSGFKQLQLNNDIYAHYFGAMAALLVLVLPLIALSFRATLRLHFREQEGRFPYKSSMLAATGSAFILLVLLLVPGLSLSFNQTWEWPTFISATFGVLLLATMWLMLSIALLMRIQSSLTAIAAIFAMMLAVIALEWLPYDLGVFSQFRYLREGEWRLGAILYFLTLSFSSLCLIVAQWRNKKNFSIVAFMLAVAACGVSQWSYTLKGNVSSLSDAQTQVLIRYAAQTRITLITPQPDDAADWLHRLETLTAQFPALALRHIHPDSLAVKERELLPGTHGLMIEYQEMALWIPLPADQIPQRIAEALDKLAQRSQVQFAFLQGHEERDLFGETAKDLSNLRRLIEDQGYRALPLNLPEGVAIPENISALVIASPRQAFSPWAQKALLQFVINGGHLLWLREPDETTSYQSLELLTGVKKITGTVMDYEGVRRGTPHAAIALVENYGEHPAFRHLSQVSALPWAAALSWETDASTEVTQLLQSHPQSFISLDPEQTNINDNGTAQSYPLGVLLEKILPDRHQRIAVIGDGHFLANTALHNYGNKALALALLQWVALGENAIAPVQEISSQSLILPEWVLKLLSMLPWLAPTIIVTLGGVHMWRWRRQ